MSKSSPRAAVTGREPVPTGIAGLDSILGGGLTRQRLHLIEGVPGAGKTTLALQCLLEGLRRGESGLYVTLSETKEEPLGEFRGVLTGVPTYEGAAGPLLKEPRR